MKIPVNLVLALLCYLAFVPPAPAQTDPVDSLRKIMYSKDALPAQRKAAREAFFQIQRENEENNRHARPQQVFLQYAQRSMEALQTTQDSIIDQLLYLVSVDTLADNYEKMAAVSILAGWLDRAGPKQDLIVDQIVKVLEDTTADLYDFQKTEAVRVLVRSQNKKAYPFLMDNYWYLRTIDDYNNPNFWFLRQEPTANWTLFPEILRLMATQKLEGDDGIILVAYLLDKIVQDPPFLIAILNLYDQRDQNPIFTENKKGVVQILQNGN